jgi:hypothetical protein
MAVSNDFSRSSPTREKPVEAVLGWRELATQHPSPAVKRRRRLLGITSFLLLVMLIFAAVRLAITATASNDQLTLRIGNQQAVTLDLRQSLPISPTLPGTNVFPRTGTTSQDGANGFMDYSPSLTTGLSNAHINLLRFPGGTWGESHYLSYDQLSAFSGLLQQTHAEGMVQARLSGPIKGNFTELSDVQSRAALAGQWVDFLNNPHSDRRIGKYIHAPFSPVKYWTVGDEPDKLINPATGQLYTVTQYVQDFILFSTVMHRVDPNIQVIGPEISEFYGPGAGPRDANGELWMEGFLKGVGAYEQANHVTLLDGVSFHRYQFVNGTQTPYLFLSSAGEWNYLLPALHQLISQDLGRDVPIALTEINTNPPNQANQAAPPQGIAALWWADTLGTLMNQQVGLVAFASASDINTPYPLFTTVGQQPTAMYRVMELFSHLQNNLIPLNVEQDPISVYATQDNAHTTVSLIFINKSNSIQLAQINALSTLFVVNPWTNLNVNLAADSIVVITLHRNAGAEAYSFTVPASNDPNAGAVLHTLCVDQSDTLQNTTPCVKQP